MSFEKILVANRGEIACRIVGSARGLGYRTVAVFSDADAGARHVREADEAVRIGASPAARSYLDGAALIAAARRSGADAIHPGYGFLSENAAFAQACIDAGLVFIGPPPAAIAAMGDKALAKRRMRDAGIACVPGTSGTEDGDEALAAAARTLGLPLLVKAVAGGGGRGMRRVRALDDLAAAIAAARGEARSAFGDAGLIVERLIESGRHIEVQVFADAHGNVIHLGERDCSAQRRHQKIVEESPSPAIGAALREALGRDAVAAARAVGYVGAGTVEFIVDDALDTGSRHYFLEMNTRLQVEHPVTEVVSGIDLVEWQLRIAAGERLPLAQHEVRAHGHAIEARLCAEDPYAQPVAFAPQTGRVMWWRPDAVRARPGVRIDDGIAEGDAVTPHYDTLLAKFVAHGRDRDDAIRRLRAALGAAPLLGLHTNAHFLRALLDSAEFRHARMTTALVDAWFAHGAPIAQRPQAGAEAWCLAGALFAQAAAPQWRSSGVAAFDLTLVCGGHTRQLRVEPGTGRRVRLTLDGEAHELHVEGPATGELAYTFGGVRRRAVALRDADDLHLALHDAQFVFHEPSALASAPRSGAADGLHANVAGVVCEIAIEPGASVEAGQPLVCIEAMKMQMWLAAPAAATVRALCVRAGEAVAAGALLVEFEPAQGR